MLSFSLHLPRVFAIHPCSPRSTIHYVAGTAGATYSPNDCTTLKCTNPSWSEFVAYEHGYLRFSALNATALAYEYVVSRSNQVIDRNLIIQVIECIASLQNIPGHQHARTSLCPHRFFLSLTLSFALSLSLCFSLSLSLSLFHVVCHPVGMQSKSLAFVRICLKLGFSPHPRRRTHRVAR